MPGAPSSSAQQHGTNSKAKGSKPSSTSTAAGKATSARAPAATGAKSQSASASGGAAKPPPYAPYLKPSVGSVPVASTPKPSHASVGRGGSGKKPVGSKWTKEEVRLVLKSFCSVLETELVTHFFASVLCKSSRLLTLLLHNIG